MLHDRIEAGRRLARHLQDLPRGEALLLGLGAGGVVVARAIADELAVPLDVQVVAELFTPGPTPIRFGAVASRGRPVLDHRALRHVLLPPGKPDALVHHWRTVAFRQEERMRGAALRRPAEGQVVVVVADGIRTALPVRAAIADLRAREPREVIVAAPVVARAAYDELAGLVDAVIALETPDAIADIAACYARYQAVSDDEAQRLLAEQLPI